MRHLEAPPRSQPNSRLRRAGASILMTLLALCCSLGDSAAAEASATPAQMTALFEAEVDLRLLVPSEDLESYSASLTASLSSVGIAGLTPQFVALVDRNPKAQIFLLLWSSPGEKPLLIGATPVSTGKPGAYDYFKTPLGVFRHHPGNPDYRAEGTRNNHGVLGYGAKGTRIFDFGWQLGRRGWGAGGLSAMRLQMHATDAELLEPLLGAVRSKGCIRIPWSLNRFLDHRGILDADYEAAAALGARLPILLPSREPVIGAGRYLVVIDHPRTMPAAWLSPQTVDPP